MKRSLVKGKTPCRAAALLFQDQPHNVGSPARLWSCLCFSMRALRELDMGKERAVSMEVTHCHSLELCRLLLQFWITLTFQRALLPFLVLSCWKYMFKLWQEEIKPAHWNFSLFKWVNSTSAIIRAWGKACNCNCMEGVCKQILSSAKYNYSWQRWAHLQGLGTAYCHRDQQGPPVGQGSSS